MLFKQKKVFIVGCLAMQVDMAMDNMLRQEVYVMVPTVWEKMKKVLEFQVELGKS